MKNLFKRAETLPVKDKVMLIEIISKWIRSVKLEKVYRENIDEDILHIEDEINERSDDEFNEIVEIEKEAEYYSEQ